MKEKILNFFKEKKELLIFVGVVLAVFATVMLIANVASKVNKNVTTEPKITTKSPTTKATTVEQVTTKKVIEKMIRPLDDIDFNISRQFYEKDSVLAVDAVIEHNGLYRESYGISYTNIENTSFDVLAVFSGKVVSVNFDEDYNNIITIEHLNGLSSTYSSVKDVCVAVGSEVKLGEKIGVSSLSNYDKDAQVHVHLELKYNGIKFNPTLAIGKTIDEIIALVS